MANYTKPTLNDIYNTIINYYQTKTAQTVPLLEIAVVKSLAWAFAGVVSLLWSFSLYQYLQIFVQTCGLEALKYWGGLVGLTYKEGSTTTIQIELTDVTANSVSAGTIWAYLETGVTYTAISSVDAVDGTVLISAQASVTGTGGDVPNGAILQIANPLAGVPDTATVVSALVTGTEEEGIEAYRQRVLIRFKKKPQGGAAIDYYLWATEVDGIIDALPYVLIEGQITVYLVSDGSGRNRTPTGSVTTNPFPNWTNGQPDELSGSGEFLAVANAINSSDGIVNDRRPLQLPVEILQPNYTAYNIKILGLSSDNADLKNSIKTAIIAYLDAKRPHVRAIGYTAQDALINSIQISSIVQNTIDTESFTSFQLLDANNNVIVTDTLGIGALAYLNSLNINGSDMIL